MPTNVYASKVRTGDIAEEIRKEYVNRPTLEERFRRSLSVSHEVQRTFSFPEDLPSEVKKMLRSGSGSAKVVLRVDVISTEENQEKGPLYILECRAGRSQVLYTLLYHDELPAEVMAEIQSRSRNRKELGQAMEGVDVVVAGVRDELSNLSGETLREEIERILKSQLVLEDIPKPAASHVAGTAREAAVHGTKTCLLKTVEWVVMSAPSWFASPLTAVASVPIVAAISCCSSSVRPHAS